MNRSKNQRVMNRPKKITRPIYNNTIYIYRFLGIHEFRPNNRVKSSEKNKKNPSKEEEPTHPWLAMDSGVVRRGAEDRGRGRRLPGRRSLPYRRRAQICADPWRRRAGRSPASSPVGSPGRHALTRSWRRRSPCSTEGEGTRWEGERTSSTSVKPSGDVWWRGAGRRRRQGSAFRGRRD